MRQSPENKALPITQKKEQEAQTPVFHRHTKPAALFLETSPFNEEGTAFDLLLLYMKICSFKGKHTLFSIMLCF